MDYLFTHDQIEAIVHYVGLRGHQSRFSSTANTLSGLSPTEAWALGMKPAYETRYGWKSKYINPEIICWDGIMHLLYMYRNIFRAGMLTDEKRQYRTIRLCSSEEVIIGKSISKSFISTSESQIDKLLALGYGNCPNLAIIDFEIEPEAIVFQMNKLGQVYGKMEEQEILVLPGMQLEIMPNPTHCYLTTGIDGKRATTYLAKVKGPDFSKYMNVNYNELFSIVFDTQTLSIVREFYHQLNTSPHLPQVPEVYDKWVRAYKLLLMNHLYNTYINNS